MERVTPPVELAGEACEKCGRQLVIKMGRYGRFIACPGFPECRNAKPLLVKVGVPCPECEADIVERRTRKRRVFYGCARYPECEWTSWTRPLRQPCPQCGGLLVEAGRDRGKCAKCDMIFPVGAEPAPDGLAASTSAHPERGGPQA
jgi:DNA topoisomerase-1